MDKSWMKKPRHTKEYVDGVNEFLKFACENCDTNSSICCPCRKCGLRKMFIPNMVYDHLIRLHHLACSWGENRGASYHTIDAQNNNEQINEGSSGMTTMLHDVFPMFDSEIVEGGPEIGVDAGEAGLQNENRQDSSERVNKFYNMLKDVDEPLYEGCTKHTKFSDIVRLWNMKCLGGLSNSIFTKLLEFVNELLPPRASLPKNACEAKKYMNELGLGYEKILACPNGCMLFWKDNENLETFVVCGASKWKQKESMDDRSKKGKRSLAKILRWFPLKTRLQRLFMSSKTSSQIKWHVMGRTNDGILRHPTDGMAWKTFDTQHDDFASDPRNVRLGL
ncbi:uncharacterized protein LOC122279492 [Carya illinoinensis]|uniref:uncharacterized protein LOC122279492 n=1 Tax=Carya illinoinensis TaxID=32201 RepID=UPI001C71B1D2|nr:uncharacterized protein LOC122279492 [Carya illinoinensis]